MELLPTIWFIAIAVLWTGYLFLEGFDLGVGMLMKAFARNNTERRVLLNTIGPVWDGNEVWLLTAAGLPLNANGDREGGPFAWFNAYAVLGGLAVVGFSLLHGLAFLALKTD